MQSRKPSKAILPHTVTLWNRVEESVVNGAPKKIYQRTVLKHVRYQVVTAATSQMAGDSRKDELKLFIFNNVYSAVNGQGNKAKHLETMEFDSMQNKTEYWTLRAGDYIALGTVEGNPGEGKTHVYTTTSVLPCYGADPDVHHWEVVAK